MDEAYRFLLIGVENVRPISVDNVDFFNQLKATNNIEKRNRQKDYVVIF